jgi:carbon-monoxide dehydrogenase medium subunit
MPNAVEPPSESPTRLEAAYALLGDATGPAWRPLAGGTDLMVQMTGEIGEPPERVLDIWALDELRGITVESDALLIGALTTYS